MDAFGDNPDQKTHVFYVREQPGDDPTIQYDTKMYRVVITISKTETTESFGSHTPIKDANGNITGYTYKYGERKVHITNYKVDSVTNSTLSFWSAPCTTV